MRCVLFTAWSHRPGPLLEVGPFPFLVVQDAVITAAVRNTEVLKQAIIEEGQITFNVGTLEDLERNLVGAGTCLPDGRVIDWFDDLRRIETPAGLREEVSAALAECLSRVVDLARPGFLPLLAALWAAEEELAEQRMRGEIVREFGRRLEGSASIHDLANYVTFPPETPSEQRLAWLKAVVDKLVTDGTLRCVEASGGQNEYDVPYELV